MRNRTLLGAITGGLVGLAFSCSGALALTNLVTNPGFETGDFTGWTENGFAVTTGPLASPPANPITPYDGSYFASLTPSTCVTTPCSLSETVPTTPGDLYNFNFYLEPGNGAGYEGAAYWNGNLLYTFGGGYNGWFPSPSYDLLATSTSTTFVIQILAVGATTAIGFDDVSVTLAATPEPATWAMMALGFAGLAFAGYRARKGAPTAA
jgi:PEP-CTERM motif